MIGGWSVAAIVLLGLSIFHAIDVLFAYLSGSRTLKGRHVGGSAVLVVFITFRICQRLMEGTL